MRAAIALLLVGCASGAAQTPYLAPSSAASTLATVRLELGYVTAPRAPAGPAKVDRSVQTAYEPPVETRASEQDLCFRPPPSGSGRCGCTAVTGRREGRELVCPKGFVPMAECRGVGPGVDSFPGELLTTSNTL